MQSASPCILAPHYFHIFFRMRPHLPNRKGSERCRHNFSEHLFFLSELSLASIASFHLFQSESFLHYAMVLGYGSFRKFSAMIVEKHMSAIVVL
jgi:hypothetical protein